MNTNPPVKLRVLVVDDHPASRRFTVAGLRQTGCSVKQAAGVREAAELLAAWWPDVILCDWNLGDGTGADVAKLPARFLPAGGSIPRMLLLTGADPGAAGSYTRHGFEHVLSKPCNLADLLEVVGVHEPLAVREIDLGGGELEEVIHAEFQQRLPQLEKLIVGRRFKEANEVTHQLVASAAFSGDARLLAALEALHRAVTNDPVAADISIRWCEASAAFEDYLRGV